MEELKKMIATPSRTMAILKENDLKMKKKYGQNFLIDPNIILKIAQSACDKDHITLEIGPGIGSLTEGLLRFSKAVYAYEIDERLIPILNKELNDRSLHVINADFLAVDLKEVPYFDETINICANLPYYVTTPILFKLFESPLKIAKITVMVQKEVADRFKAQVNDEDYNALSVIVNYLYDVRTVLQVPPNVFYPRPNVFNTVISFTPKVKRDPSFEASFFTLIKHSFTQRRKTLWNNLKEHYPEDSLKKAYANLQFTMNIRAQELDLKTFLNLYEELI